MTVAAAYYVICDDCGDESNFDCTTPEEAREKAKRDGWRIVTPSTGGSDFCEKCKLKHQEMLARMGRPR